MSMRQTLSLILVFRRRSVVGQNSLKAVGWLMVVVKIKKVIRRKPRSTIGVRSTLVESFYLFNTRSFLMPTSAGGIHFCHSAEIFCYKMIYAEQLLLIHQGIFPEITALGHTLRIGYHLKFKEFVLFKCCNDVLNCGYLATLSPFNNRLGGCPPW